MSPEFRVASPESQPLAGFKGESVIVNDWLEGLRGDSGLMVRQQEPDSHHLKRGRHPELSLFSVGSKDLARIFQRAIDSPPSRDYHFLAAIMHHATNSPPWFLFLFITLGIAIVIWAILSARKRTQELTQLAPQLGFTFMGKAWHGPVLDPLHKTSLLQRTRGGFSNVMAGSAGNLQTIVFDYSYKAGKSTSTQTMACFSNDKQLPPFMLKHENLFDRLGDTFLHNDIDFASNPVFSERYALKSPDEQGTRRLFTPSLLTSMEQIPADKAWTIETSRTSLFVYRHGRTVSAADLPIFLQETSTIARTIFSSDGLKNPAF